MAPVAGPALCLPILDCSIDQCSGHGTCYMTGGQFACRCEDGWEGERCSIKREAIAAAAGASISVGAIIAIIACLLILLCKLIYVQMSWTQNLNPLPLIFRQSNH